MKNLFLNLQIGLRPAVIKKVELLPNISVFNTFQKGYNEYALIYGLRKIEREYQGKKFRENDFANRYMLRQMRRIDKLLSDRKYSKAVNLMNYMLQNSVVFRLYALNRTIPKWFNEKPHAVRKL